VPTGRPRRPWTSIDVFSLTAAAAAPALPSKAGETIKPYEELFLIDKEEEGGGVVEGNRIWPMPVSRRWPPKPGRPCRARPRCRRRKSKGDGRGEERMFRFFRKKQPVGGIELWPPGVRAWGWRRRKGARRGWWRSIKGWPLDLVEQGERE